MNLITSFILSACILISVTEGSAQQKRMLYTAKGVYLPVIEKLGNRSAIYYGYNAAQVTTMRNNMNNFMELVHQTPCINPPKGYEVKVFATVCENGSCNESKVMTGYTGLLIREYTTTNGKPVPQLAAEGPSIKFWYNDIRSWLYRGVWNESGFEEPEVVGEIGGCPVLKGGYVVITQNKKPMFRAVTREEILKISIKEAEADVTRIKETQSKGSAYQQWLNTKDASLKDMKDGLDILAKTDPEAAKAKWEKLQVDFEKLGQDMKNREAKELEANRKYLSGYEQRLQGFRQELASLSAVARKEPVVNSERKKVVLPNPEFWDPARKPTDLQLVVIDLLHYDLVNGDYAHELIREIRKTLNVANLAAYIK